MNLRSQRVNEAAADRRLQLQPAASQPCPSRDGRGAFLRSADLERDGAHPTEAAASVRVRQEGAESADAGADAPLQDLSSLSSLRGFPHRTDAGYRWDLDYTGRHLLILPGARRGRIVSGDGATEREIPLCPSWSSERVARPCKRSTDGLCLWCGDPVPTLAPAGASSVLAAEHGEGVAAVVRGIEGGGR